MNKNWTILLFLAIYTCGCSTSNKEEKPNPSKITPKVMIIIFNPIIESEGNKRLTEVIGWNNPDSLVKVYQNDIYEVSDEYLDYQIVQSIEVDEYPVKLDGFCYTDETFLECWREQMRFHQPDAVDYIEIFDKFNIFQQVEGKEIDEIWCFAFPYSGFWETTMAGKGAFYCNSNPVPNTENCSRKFITYGFNYEREVGCMLEDFGHMTESVMSHVYRDIASEHNLWKQFTLYDKIAPGKSNCCNVHFAPNSEKDYDWGNTRYVQSNCDDWYNFPNFKGITRKVNCEEWGNGDMREQYKWWLKHIPLANGQINGIYNNWWYYLSNPNFMD